jgi:D-tyrosyl-tRNA(Tyr) deacylase
MRAVVQRVVQARVTVGEATVGEIGRGFLVLLGVARDDEPPDAERLAARVSGLRLFEDEAGKMNLALSDVGGAMLVVSQFTLYADCSKGRRPSFVDAAPPELAEALYRRFVDEVAARGIPTATGRFRAEMQVALVNDGPVTVIVESRR